MKPRGQHPNKALSATGVRNLAKPGRYADGNGLYLVVDLSGAKRWLLRTVVHGRRRDIGLGGLQLVSLAEARETAAEYRRIARSGGDPLEAKRAIERAVPTFEDAARQAHAERLQGWKNAKHADQWINTLRDYAFPLIGKSRIDVISTADLLGVLSPIWLTKPETARRVKQRIAAVFDWARAAGYRSTDNPASGLAQGLPRQPPRKTHHSALDYRELPVFMETLRGSAVSEPVRLALEFLILTAARTVEVINADWSEIDLEKCIWTIPAARMKASVEHKVPLTDRCNAILERARSMGTGIGLIFPGRRPSKPISNMTLLKAARQLGGAITVHGFRSSFRDWAAEQTSFPHDVCEMALAHTIKNKAEAAYRRGDLLEKRRRLMEAWANYAASKGGNVVSIAQG